MKTQRAFTLIELLVVVTIILALLAMLGPALTQAVAIAHGTACLSNQRQLSLAHLGYASDHLGTHAPASTDTARPHWLELMRWYTSNLDDIRNCPETSGYQVDPTSTSGGTQVYGSRNQRWWLNKNTYGVGFYGGGSYGVNVRAHSTAGWGSNIAKHFRTVKDSPFPTNTPLLADCIWHNSFPNDTDAPSATEPTSVFGNSMMGRHLVRRHQNGINVVMLDTSAHRYELERLWTLDWHRSFNRTDDVAIPY